MTALERVSGASTWAFIVSVLEWQETASYISFPKAARRDAELVRYFTEDRKVPADHILVYKDSQAKLADLKADLRSFAARGKPGDLFFFYYAGHGDREKPGITYLIPFDGKSADVAGTAWSVDDILEELESGFKGSWVLLAADCCHSGGLCQAASSLGKKAAYGCLASAQSSSPSTGEWTFTDSLLRGLTGSSRADLDGDRRVDFSELASHIESEMAFGERQLSAAAVTGRFTPATKLADVSRSDLALPRVVVRWRDGRDYNGTVLGDCATDGGRPGQMIRYGGYKESADECVEASAVRPYSVPARRFAAQTKVYAEWEKSWYAATVLDYRLGLHRIGYDGFSEYWDEWVPADLLRTEPPCSPAPCKAP